jgi:predicted nucleic acid-binding protein
MIVIADTSPLNYLALIDEIDLLPAIFGRVLLPQGVFQELGHPKPPRRCVND